MSDELALPFVFVPDDEAHSPEAAEFRARHPDWASFPATLVLDAATGAAEENREEMGHS